MQKRCTVDLWTAGYAGSRLTAQARSPMDKPWTTLRVAHRLPTGRRLPTSSTALNPIVIESGKVKTKTPAPALAYSSPVAVQTTGTTAVTRFWITKSSDTNTTRYGCPHFVFSCLLAELPAIFSVQGPRKRASRLVCFL